MWRNLATATGNELNLKNTLLNGQCFNWVQAKTVPLTKNRLKLKEQRFIGVLNGNVVLLSQCYSEIQQLRGEHLHLTTVRYKCLNAAKTDTEKQDRVGQDLHAYFQLDESLEERYKHWGKQCPRVASICACLPGLRVVRQDPLECLISFICSSNNNISRITQMLTKMRSKFGKKIKLKAPKKKLREETGLDDCTFYEFPSLEQLSKIGEQDLRDLGFGYRAKFITLTVQKLIELGGVKFLHDLRDQDTSSQIERIRLCRDQLVQFHGVGRKVADCVALFSLDCTGCIPVDTHVWQIACRYYDSSLLDTKSLTPTIYDRVNSLFVDKFGIHAGWAHSILFAAELPLFRQHLTERLISEMDEAKEWEKKLKLEKKAKKRKKTKQNARKPSDQQRHKVTTEK